VFEYALAAGTTSGATVYIRDATTGATNNYALWVDAGTSRFDGNISVQGTLLDAGSTGVGQALIGTTTVYGHAGAHSTLLLSNSYRNAADDFKYLLSTAATRVAMSDNGISFETAPTGTAGNTITFVEQVRITHTASATRYITLTGSNGGNPTIGVSAGNLAITPAVAFAGTLTVAQSQTVDLAGSSGTNYGRIYYSSGGNTGVYIENAFDDAASEIRLRTRTLGTPVEVGLFNAAGLNVSGYVVAPTGFYVGSGAEANHIDDATNGAGSTTLYIGNASINVTSDERVKSAITPLQDGLGIVRALLPIEFEVAGTIQGRRKRTVSCMVRLLCTQALYVNPESLEDVSGPQGLLVNGEDMMLANDLDEPVVVGEPFSGDLRTEAILGWDRQGRISITTAQPIRFTVLGIEQAVDVEEP